MNILGTKVIDGGTVTFVNDAVQGTYIIEDTGSGDCQSYSDASAAKADYDKIEDAETLCRVFGWEEWYD